jgi:hypothetical protein
LALFSNTFNINFCHSTPLLCLNQK